MMQGIIIPLLAVFATLFVVACGQPTPDPTAVQQCVDQAAAQDSTLQQCLQLFMERLQSATSLAVYCGTQCPALVENIYSTCGSQDTQSFTRNCEDSFTRTIVNSQFCVSRAVAATPALQSCQRQFFDIVFEDPQSTSVGPFCTSCGQSLATLYSNCGPAVDMSSRILFGPTFTELFQGGCALDDMGRYCSDVVRRVTGEPNRSQLVEDAIQACENIGSTCTPACRDAIDALGCCVHFEQLFRGPNDPMLPLDVCGVPECPQPFSLNPSTSNPGGTVCRNGDITVSLSMALLTVSVAFSTALTKIF